MTEKTKSTGLRYQLLSWGPCVAKLKITDEFKNLLLKEGEASSTKEYDYQTRLAGILQKELLELEVF